MSWWVIEDVALRAALNKAYNMEDIGTIEAELYANSYTISGDDAGEDDE
jgi:hypothetical protein